jgi:hypothetical protein
VGQHHSTQRKVPCGLPDEARLTEDITALAEEFGRFALPPLGIMRCMTLPGIGQREDRAHSLRFTLGKWLMR